MIFLWVLLLIRGVLGHESFYKYPHGIIPKPNKNFVLVGAEAMFGKKRDVDFLLSAFEDSSSFYGFIADGSGRVKHIMMRAIKDDTKFKNEIHDYEDGDSIFYENRGLNTNSHIDNNYGYSTIANKVPDARCMTITRNPYPTAEELCNKLPRCLGYWGNCLVHTNSTEMKMVTSTHSFHFKSKKQNLRSIQMIFFSVALLTTVYSLKVVKRKHNDDSFLKKTV
jgi:hypothetical protein